MELIILILAVPCLFALFISLYWWIELHRTINKRVLTVHREVNNQRSFKLRE